VRSTDNLATFMWRLSRNSGSLSLLDKGPIQGLLYLFTAKSLPSKAPLTRPSIQTPTLNQVSVVPYLLKPQFLHCAPTSQSTYSFKVPFFRAHCTGGWGVLYPGHSDRSSKSASRPRERRRASLLLMRLEWRHVTRMKERRTAIRLNENTNK
jgi:hypothetical protein